MTKLDAKYSPLSPLSLIWLEEVYSLVDHDPDAAIDVLFARVDDWLSAGEFHHCNTLLQTMDTQRLDTNLLVAVLSATHRVAEYLPDRPAFVHRVRARLQDLAPDRVERLLTGLS